jgi:hypothetical protein
MTFWIAQDAIPSQYHHCHNSTTRFDDQVPIRDLVMSASSSSSSSSEERVYQFYRAHSAPGRLLSGLSPSLNEDNSDQPGAPPYPENTGQEQEQPSDKKPLQRTPLLRMLVHLVSSDAAAADHCSGEVYPQANIC